jgi:peptidoglycan/LPS O-acetylase OafA/YrhL
MKLTRYLLEEATMPDLEVRSQPLAQIPAFDGFRGVAVLVVIFGHLPQVVDSELYNVAWNLNQAPRLSYVALDVFFAISGFFITRLLLRERAKTGHISFSNFYARRALRIVPVYYIVVVSCYFVFHFGAWDTLSLLSYTSNFYHPFHPAPHPLEQTWSLSVEEQFYFFWPLLVLLVPQRLLSVVTGRVVPALAIVSGLLIAARYGGRDNVLSGDLVYMSIFTRMLSLSLGGWLAVREFEKRSLRGRYCVMLLATALLLLIGDRIGRDTGVITSQAAYWTVALAAYAMISVSFVSTMIFGDGIVKRKLNAVLSTPILRGVGRISYAMYVVHLPVLFYLGLNDGTLSGTRVPLMQVVLAFAITLALSVLSYFAIERPLSSFKGKFGGAPTAAQSIVGSLDKGAPAR